MRIAVASDHAGSHVKELLLNRLAAEPDLSLVDLGTDAPSPPVDYPDYARAAAEAVVRGDVDRAIMVCGSGAAAGAPAAEAVVRGDVDRAIMVCGSGAGACIAADKIPGARAFLAGDTYTA